MAGRTMAEKVWEQHVVRSAEGEPDLLYIDLHLLHEVTSPQAFDGLRLAGRGVRRSRFVAPARGPARGRAAALGAAPRGASSPSPRFSSPMPRHSADLSAVARAMGWWTSSRP